MTLIPEDGTGLSTANSLTSVAFAQAYWSVRAASAVWTNGKQAQQETWLVLATDYVERRYRFGGAKNTYAQALCFPRTGLSERDGQDVPNNVVPGRIQQGVAFLAGLIAAGWVAEPTLKRGGQILSQSVAGVIAQTFGPNAAIEDAIAYVDGLFFPYLSAAGVMDTTAARRMQYPSQAIATFTGPTVPDEFAPGAFGNDGAAIPP